MNKPSQRIASIDALRGFDMLWITGAEAIIVALAALSNWPIFDSLAYHMQHAPWAGFRFYDNIFPMFLFLAGVTIPFSILGRKERGDSMTSIWRHMLKRLIVLFLFGLVVNGAFAHNWAGLSNIRYASVLGRIGIAWFLASALSLYCGIRVQALIFVFILLAYWAVVMLIPVPGFGAGILTPEGNLEGYIDRLLLPGIKYIKVMDPEGILSTFPAITTAMLGVFTGHLLKVDDQRISRYKKTLYMFLAGIALLCIGRVWSIWFPIIKSMWTSTFVLFAGGVDLLFLSFFYLIIDVWNFKKWSVIFRVIGMNSILIYLCTEGVMPFYNTRNHLLNVFVSGFLPAYQPLVSAIGLLLVEWFFLYFLYKKKIFLKV
jgi:predicted acyltransferase